MNNDRRLIEVAFPLKQASLDSVHEKIVCHGHISTLHIWPARRPLAACRAAPIATLLPDPSTSEARKALCESRPFDRLTEGRRGTRRAEGKVEKSTSRKVESWGRRRRRQVCWVVAAAPGSGAPVSFE